ncbi:MAG: response regulator [Fuerstiella sp.]|nr:response regulator [Fuerstiella sp.]
MEDQPTLFLVDHDPAVLHSLSEIADTMGLRSETYCCVADFLAGFGEGRRGCLVVDIGMPGTSGLDLHAQLIAAGHVTRTIVITNHGTIAMCVKAMQAGAVSFLEKPLATEDLVVAIRQALAEDADRHRVDKVRDAFERKADQLTCEEKRGLGFIARGKICSAIADELDVSLRTIQFRRASIWKKLGISSRDALMELLIDRNVRRPRPD